jgi:hypothetical protein
VTRPAAAPAGAATSSVRDALVPAKAFVELSPGPTYNTLGEADGKPIISIQDTPTYPTAGNLDLTTVNERGGPGHAVYLGRVIVGWADPSVRVVPREAFYPDDVDPGDVAAQNTQMFSDSESDAIAAALRYLERPVITLTVVSQVVTGGPSDGKLAPAAAITGAGHRAPDGHRQMATQEADRVRLAGRQPEDVTDRGTVDDRPARSSIAGTTYSAVPISVSSAAWRPSGDHAQPRHHRRFTPGEPTAGSSSRAPGSRPTARPAPSAHRAASSVPDARARPCSCAGGQLRRRRAGVPDGLTVAKVSTSPRP